MMENISSEKNLNGVLNVYKPLGITSNGVVTKIRRFTGIKKVGHTGTLDPMATGVLTVLIGRAAKAAEYLVSDRKTYLATLRLGLTTDTEDIEGRVLTRSEMLPTKEEVLAVLARFRGQIEQIPPMYSALKVGGKKLCDLARKGVEVERSARQITVFRLELLECDPAAGRYLLNVECSKGTYIRTLVSDIGAALGCGGTMESLRRAKAGSFTLTDCVSLETLEQMEMAERIAALKPAESLFDDWQALHLPAFFARRARNGCEIYLNKLGIDHPVGARFSLYREEDGFFALGQVQEFPEGKALRVIKLFKL